MKKIFLLSFLLTLVCLKFNGYSQTYVFTCPTTTTTWTVPTGVTAIVIDVRGAAGGAAGPLAGITATTPGNGGRTQATLAVTAGTVLNIYVGGLGPNGTATGTAGGFNGGGSSISWGDTWSGGGGGGASDIRIGGVALANRVIVGAGGGGAGFDGTCTSGNQPGGNGGGLTGASAVTCTGTLEDDGYSVTNSGGGTATGGGVGGDLAGGLYSAGAAGTLGNGGNSSTYGGIAGGGGGGYYGGGGGCWMGGGGGSSYASAAIATAITYTSGYNTGCGYVSITVVCNPGTITGTDMVCIGSTTNLTDAITGGTWTSSATSIVTVGSTGIVSGISGGTATISYTMAGGCYTTAIVTVNPNPTTINGTTTVCAGLTTTLTDGSGTSTWTSSTTSVATVVSTTGVVTGVSGGTSEITFTIASTGCYTVTAVTVNPTPAAITGTLNVCVGSTTDLGDGTVGGTWSSSNAAVGTIGSSTGDVYGVNSGTTIISYTLNTGCQQTAIVTVNALPGPITGNTGPICQTFTLGLADGIGGGVWSSLSTGIAIVTGVGLVTGVGVDTTTIVYSIGSCISTTVVTVNTQPAVITGGPFAICDGSSVTITDATGGGVWSSSTGAVSLSGSETVTGETVGTSIITYAIAGCQVMQAVTVNTQPSAITGNTGPICQSFTLALADGSGGVWSSLATGIATITGGGLVTGVGVDTTTIVNSIGSCIATTVVTVNTQPVGITGTFVMCDGSSVTITDGTGGGLWSSSTGAVSLSAGETVTGESVGTSTILYAIGSCSVTQTVTVNTQPVAISGNTGAICQTFTLSLSDGTVGGVWSSSTTTVAQVSGTGGVTGIGSGTATITYEIGSCYVTTVVTVNTQPVAIIGIFSICDESSTTLTDATIGGTWSSSNMGVGTIGNTSGTLTGEGVGTTTITYAIGSCSVTQAVTVNTQPVGISGNTMPICQTFSMTVTDLTSGGLWSSVTTTIAQIGSISGIITGEGVGMSVISYSIGSCVATTIVTVDTQPDPIGGTLSVCQGLSTTLNDGTGGGTWSSVNMGVGTVSTTGIVTGLLNGTTTISYTLGICAAEAEVTVNPLPVAITGADTVCSGSTTDLHDGTGGGTWSSSATTVATIGLTTGVVTGQTVGVASTATITYTVGTGCTITTVITVNPSPTGILGPDAVCLGSMVTLSDAGGGTWSSNNTGIATIGSASGIVTGEGVGVTTLTYTLPTGCYITAPMTVNALPTAITGPTLVCVGSTITLDDGTGGGVWTSSNTTLATVGVGTGIVSGISVGLVTITYTLGTGCYVTYTVTVNTPSAIITPVGDTTFCPGGFVALTANTGAGLSYQWYAGGVAIPGSLSSSYIATAAGSYQVEVTNSSGCSAFSLPMSVTIDVPVASITASGSTTICSGTTITLSANLGSGLSYQWLLGGVAISGAVGSSYTTNITGDYSVVVTTGVGCSATSNVITVSTNPSPTANISLSGPLTFCQGDSVVMATGVVTGNVYQWYNGGGAITGTNNQSFTATGTGTYYVIVTNSYGCTATSIVVSVVVNPLPDVTITASGSTLFCTGGSVTLSANAVGGDTYQWYVGGSAIAGATTSSYLATTGGGYRVQISNPVSGCTATTLSDVVVTEVGTPVIIPITPASFCWGGSALLSTSLSGASGTVTYQWLLNGVAIPGATGPTYNAAVAGDYSCRITIPGSCTAATISIPVTEYPLPNPIVSLTGGTLTTDNYYVAYQWYKNLVQIPGATGYSTAATGNGDYKVAVTDTNGCQSYSDVYVDTGSSTGGGTTGIGAVNAGGNIQIYPNPAQTMVHISSGIQVRALVNSIDGRTILNIAGAKDIDITGLADGIYMILLYDDNGIMVKAEKLVKAAN